MRKSHLNTAQTEAEFEVKLCRLEIEIGKIYFMNESC
jgi:hypothetical protein